MPFSSLQPVAKHSMIFSDKGDAGMLRVAVLNAKGGVGKTMLSTILATQASYEFKRVALVDLDPQMGSRRWWHNRGEPDNPTVMTGEYDAKAAIEALMQTGWDVVFFDGAPGLFTSTRSAVAACDLTVIPMLASDQDFGAARDVVAECVREAKRHLVVLNAVLPSDKHVSSFVTTLRTLQWPVAKTVMQRRSAHVLAANGGRIVSELTRRTVDEKGADADVKAIYAEVMAIAREVRGVREGRSGARKR
jgi:cellulose biosynthesis protein BcsQ